MDAASFQTARANLEALLAERVETLEGVSDDLRPDGLPQDWVDGLGALLEPQRSELAALISNDAPGWARALRDLLVA